MWPSIQTLIASSIGGLVLNTRLPTCRIDLSDACAEAKLVRQGGLDASSQAHHAILATMNPGSYAEIMGAQSSWRQSLASDPRNEAAIFVEQEMPLGDMVARAAAPLLPQLSAAGNLVISCQNTRESSVSPSYAGRILKEAACGGFGCTVGQRGLASATQALETALVLSRNERFTGSILICAGDRWIDIYPRILGDWALLSDGAAAVVFRPRHGAKPNLWVINGRVSAYVRMAGTARESSIEVLRGELVGRLDAFITTVQAQRKGSMAIASPWICGTLGEEVTAVIVSRYRLIRSVTEWHPSHFGAANALINLHRLRILHQQNRADDLPDSFLVWDCDPSGLFGAVAVDRCAFATAS